MILVIVLLLLVGVCYLKYTGNKELIKTNCKDDKDIANAKNARKVYSKTKTTLVLLIAAIALFIIVLLLNFTDIDYIIRDFISTDFVERNEFSFYYYLVPLYILVCRQIIIEVNIGDFLYKYFKVDEPEPKENIVKTVLTKKKNNKKETLTFEEKIKAKEEELAKINTEQIDILEEEPAKVNIPKVETNPTEPPLAREQEKLDLPEIKKEDK